MSSIDTILRQLSEIEKQLKILSFDSYYKKDLDFVVDFGFDKDCNYNELQQDMLLILNFCKTQQNLKCSFYMN